MRRCSSPVSAGTMLASTIELRAAAQWKNMAAGPRPLR